MFGIDDCRIHVRKDAEFIGNTDVVAIRGDSITNDPFSHLAISEGLNHLMLQRHAPDPAVWLNRHPRLLDYFWRDRKLLAAKKKPSVDEAPCLDNPQGSL